MFAGSDFTQQCGLVFGENTIDLSIPRVKKKSNSIFTSKVATQTGLECYGEITNRRQTNKRPASETLGMVGVFGRAFGNTPNSKLHLNPVRMH